MYHAVALSSWEGDSIAESENENPSEPKHKGNDSKSFLKVTPKSGENAGNSSSGKQLVCQRDTTGCFSTENLPTTAWLHADEDFDDWSSRLQPLFVVDSYRLLEKPIYSQNDIHSQTHRQGSHSESLETILARLAEMKAGSHIVLWSGGVLARGRGKHTQVW